MDHACLQMELQMYTDVSCNDKWVVGPCGGLDWCCECEVSRQRAAPMPHFNLFLRLSCPPHLVITFNHTFDCFWTSTASFELHPDGDSWHRCLICYRQTHPLSQHTGGGWIAAASYKAHLNSMTHAASVELDCKVHANSMVDVSTPVAHLSSHLLQPRTLVLPHPIHCQQNLNPSGWSGVDENGLLLYDYPPGRRCVYDRYVRTWCETTAIPRRWELAYCGRNSHNQMSPEHRRSSDAVSNVWANAGTCWWRRRAVERWQTLNSRRDSTSGR